MQKRNFNLVFRKLRKDFRYTIMIVLGLAFGFAGTGLISLYVANELTVDKFNSENAQVFHARHLVGSGGVSEFALTPGPLATALAELPEVGAVTRIVRYSFKVEIPEKQAVFNEYEALYVDNSFFKVFDYPFLSKATEIVMDEPNTAVVTESAAMKYFGTTDALGKTITIKLGVLNKQLKVDGVVKDFPLNSSIQNNLFISLNTHTQGNVNVEPVLTQWRTPYFLTYFKTHQAADLSSLQAKMDLISEQYFGNYSEESYASFLAEGGRWEFPLERFDKQYISGTSPFSNGNRENVNALMLIGIVILGLVTVNFLNLWTLKTIRRSKEFGVRKFLGASGKHIFKLFFLEATIYFVTSALIALAISEFLLVQFFSTSLSEWAQVFIQFPWMAGLGLLFVLLFMFGVSTYPSWAYMRIKVIHSLKGKFNSGKWSVGIRSLLMGMQLAITLSFMIVLYFMNGQVQYLQERDMGWTPENLMVVRDPFSAIYENKHDFKAFLAAMEAKPGIESAAVSNVNLARGVTNVLISKRDNIEEKLNVKFAAYAGSFFETFDIQFDEGREINSDFQNIEVVINQTAARKFKLSVGDMIDWYGRSRKVVGITQDILIPPFSVAEQPMLFGRTLYPSRRYYVRIDPQAAVLGQKNLEEVWSEFMGTTPFDAYPISEDITLSLQRELELSRLISYFSLFALLISSLGVLAITGFVCELKLKEVGIRKVLGAAHRQIYSMISVNFYKVLLLAFLVAVPVSVLIANNWLDGYSDRIAIEGWSILVIGLINMALITMIVFGNSIKTIRMNPATILRDE